MGNYDGWFYCFVILLTLSVITVLAQILYQPKPLICITSEALSFNIERKTVYHWESIREISIGVSSLKIEDANRKSGYINLESIRHNDIKMLKSKIIEMCETKKIPYKNDY
jgi:hypothetical protein